MEHNMVYICSPLRAYSGCSLERNIVLCKHYCQNVASDNFMPIAPHLLFPRFLDDDDADQRELALQFCEQLLSKCSQVFVFDGNDGYRSSGMWREISYARNLGIPIVEIPSEHPYRDVILLQQKCI